MSDHLYEIFNYVISYYSETETIIVFQCDTTSSDPTHNISTAWIREPIKQPLLFIENECCLSCMFYPGINHLLVRPVLLLFTGNHCQAERVELEVELRVLVLVSGEK